MDFFFGTEVIEALQSALAPTLDLLFILFTLLGEDYIYMSLIAITYWCFNKNAALKTAYVLLASAYLNYWLKMSFNMDKPPSEYRIILKDDISHGFPSGHTQNAVTFWGWLAFKSRKAWMPLLSLVLVFMIGLSRIYLGVHYLGDVLGGLLFGGIFLAVAYKTVPYLESKLSSIPRWFGDYLTPVISVLLFGLSLAVFPDTARGDSALICGSLFGFTLGSSLESKHLNISMDVNRRTKAVRSVVGLPAVFGLYLMVSFVLISVSFSTVYTRFLRYAIIGLTITLVTPIIFRFMEK